MKFRILPLLVFVLLPPAAARAQSRRVYEGVVDMKQKTIGTLIMLETGPARLRGWIRLEKFVPVDGGTVRADSVEFSAAGNTYQIDEKRGRIAYSGPDGSGNSIISRLTPITGDFQELTEGEGFGNTRIVTMDVDGRMRRFHEDGPSLWKRKGPPFETFRRMEELLQRRITIWVSDPDAPISDIEMVEEPRGMNIPLKTPKKRKRKK